MLFCFWFRTIREGPHPIFRGWSVERQKWSQRKCGIQNQSAMNLACRVGGRKYYTYVKSSLMHLKEEKGKTCVLPCLYLQAHFL